MDYNDGLPALFLGAGFISLHHLFCILFLILPLRHDRVSHARCTLCSVSGVYRFSFLSSWAWSLYVCVFFSYTISSMPIDSFILFFAGDCHPFETLQYSYCIHLGLLRIHASLPPPPPRACVRCQFEMISEQFSELSRRKFLSKYIILFCVFCVWMCAIFDIAINDTDKKMKSSDEVMLASANLSYTTLFHTTIIMCAKIFTFLAVSSFAPIFSSPVWRSSQLNGIWMDGERKRKFSTRTSNSMLTRHSTFSNSLDSVFLFIKNVEKHFRGMFKMWFIFDLMEKRGSTGFTITAPKAEDKIWTFFLFK